MNIRKVDYRVEVVKVLLSNGQIVLEQEILGSLFKMRTLL